MHHGLVSVVIPTYNRAYCIEKAIDSVLRQTRPRVEVVVVDDGSTDDTRALLERRYGGDARVKVVPRPNGGVTAARNTGLRECTGDFIALLDSDDMWMPWKLELQLACLEALPQAGMIWTDMQAVDASGAVFAPRFLRIMYSAYEWFPREALFSESLALPKISCELPADAGRLYGGEIFSQMIMGNLVHTSTVLLRRERFEKVGSFDEALRTAGEDYDFHLRTCKEGPVAFADVASIVYQKGMPDQLTGPSHAIHRARNFLRTIAPHIERDRERIRLPQKMVDRALADAYAYIGEMALDIGETAEARHHLLQTLTLRPWQPRQVCLLAVSVLPSAMGHRLRDAYRAVKALGTGRVDS